MKRSVILLILLGVIVFTSTAQSTVIREPSLDAPAAEVPVLTFPADQGSITTTFYTFTWTGDANATRYIIQVQTIDRSFRVRNVATPDQAKCVGGDVDCEFTPSDFVLPNNTALRWRVTARDGSGKVRSPWSTFTTAIPAASPSTLNTPTSGSETDDVQPEFSWTPGANARRYQLIVRKFNGQLVLKHKVKATACVGTCTVDLADLSIKLTDAGTHTWFVKSKSPYGTANSTSATFNYVPLVAKEVLALVNAARCEAQLAPLALNNDLNEAAQRHSNDMAKNSFLDHTGSDGSRFWDRIADAGYVGNPLGENAAAGYTDAQSVFDAWWKSEGHQKNMMNPNAREMGLAYAYNPSATYGGHRWTQVFAANGSTVLGVCP